LLARKFAVILDGEPRLAEKAMNRKERNDSGEVVLTLMEEKVRTALLESGLPYSEVERRCAVSVPALSRFCKRERALSAANLCKVVEVLGCDIVAVTEDGRYLPIQVKQDLRTRPQGRLTQEEEGQVERTSRLASSPSYAVIISPEARKDLAKIRGEKPPRAKKAR
jgi:transcriptional regulator with XRE-family HTH domain